MNTASNWPTTNIFHCYKVSHGLVREAIEGLERIGLYTFQFHADGSGVQIQRNILGRIEKIWDIHYFELGSKEAAVTYHWKMLEKMAANDSTAVERQLNRLANRQEEIVLCQREADMTMTRMYYTPSGRREPLHKIIMPPFLLELAEAITKHLESHGLTIEPCGEHIVITLPEGTYQEELFPVVESSRYTVTLPDGYQFIHIQTRWGHSTITIPIHDLPTDAV